MAVFESSISARPNIGSIFGKKPLKFTANFWPLTVLSLFHILLTLLRLSVLNWNALRGRTLISPIRQPYNGPSDARNFDMFNPESYDPVDEQSGWDMDF